jgi:CelD/BcsL family acetyltransferase involved in cellulose biosynthesis
MIHGSILWVGDNPVAFTFGLDCGDTRYCIANNFDPRFRKHSPGRILLYEDFQAAAARGVRQVNWGIGDGGYKREMGAEAGAQALDLLFVRNTALAMLAKPFWR